MSAAKITSGITGAATHLLADGKGAIFEGAAALKELSSSRNGENTKKRTNVGSDLGVDQHVLVVVSACGRKKVN